MISYLAQLLTPISTFTVSLDLWLLRIDWVMMQEKNVKSKIAKGLMDSEDMTQDTNLTRKFKNFHYVYILFSMFIFYSLI